MGLMLSISNIAWEEKDDICVYEKLKKFKYNGVEIAPTRVFGEHPYDKIQNAKDFSDKLLKKYSLKVSSIQSIWYGKNEKIFGSQGEREELIKYTQKAIIFAESIGAGNLVMGCPKNRSISSSKDYSVAIAFFRELGEFAHEHNTVLAIEANPEIYNTNFINTTQQAIKMVREVDSKGFLLNLDVGTMINNYEDINILDRNIDIINHVHISEPYLKCVKERELHKKLINWLKANDYKKYLSIEMAKQENINILTSVMEYIMNLCD